MTDSLLNMAKELALAQIKAGQVTPDNMISVLNSTYETLRQLNAAEQSETAVLTSTAAMDWRKSITKHAIICLECGVTFKQLSARHLRLHDLNGRSYRDKYGIPRVQSLSAREVHAKRLAIVKRVRPWEKSPTHQKTKQEAVAIDQPDAPKKTTKKAAPKGRRGAPSAS